MKVSENLEHLARHAWHDGITITEVKLRKILLDELQNEYEEVVLGAYGDRTCPCGMPGGKHDHPIVNTFQTLYGMITIREDEGK